MKIEKVEVFKIGSRQFNTEAEAIEFARSERCKNETFQYNLKHLGSSCHLYVACIDTQEEPQLRLFTKRYNNFDQGYGWEDLLGNEHLRNLETSLMLLTSGEFINKFAEHADTIHMEAGDLGELIVALRWHISRLENGSKLFEKVFDALEKIKYNPVYIYE